MAYLTGPMPWGGEQGKHSQQIPAAASHSGQPNDTVYATDLSQEFDEGQLGQSFGSYGTIVWAKVMKAATKVSALVQYSSTDEAAFIVQNPEVLGLNPTPKLSFHVKKWKIEKSEKNEKWGAGSNGAGSFGGEAHRGGGTARPSPYGGKGAQGGKGYEGSRAGGGGGDGDTAVLKKGLGRNGLLPMSQWQHDEGAVFVSNLPHDCTDEDLYEIFAPFGAIPPRGVKAMKDALSKCKGFGFVDFIDPECAQAAIAALDGYTNADGTILRVKLKTSKKA